MNHFEGKTVTEHLKVARAKGTFATAEIHGAEMSGFFFSALDTARDTSIILLLLWIVFPSTTVFFVVFAASLLIWKMGRSALLGWARLERLHRLIEEERWEIEHNRDQEREELTALYKAKGLSGKLLDEVIAVLMADDNRLLRIMLEEELGLTLEVYEHPLKQSLGAGIGVVLATCLFFILPPYIATFLTVFLVAMGSAKLERNRLIESIIWNLSVAGLSAGAAYFLKILL